MEIVGNDAILQRLKRIAAGAGPAPSYLFEGPDGVGKGLVARWFMQLLLCDGEERPCGLCPSCRKVLSGNHPDVMILDRVPGKASIGVDDVREGIEAVQERPYEGRYRFWLFSEAGRLTEEAQSALLKTLEEPPRDLVMLLVAGSGASLLPTVVSRCRGFRFLPVTRSELAGWLEERGFPADVADVAARTSGGCPGRALEFLESEEGWELRRATLEAVNALVDADIWGALEVAVALEGLNKHKDDPKRDYRQVLQIVRSYYRDALFMATGAKDDLLVNVDCLGALGRLAQARSLIQLEADVAAIGEAEKHLERNVQTKLWLQRMCLELSK